MNSRVDARVVASVDRPTDGRTDGQTDKKNRSLYHAMPEAGPTNKMYSRTVFKVVCCGSGVVCHISMDQCVYRARKG